MNYATVILATIFFELIYKIRAGPFVSFPFCLYSYIMSLLSKIYTLQPAFSRTLVRSHSTKSTHFLNDFMTSKEKGPIQISIENKVIIYNQYSGLVTHGLFH